MADEITVSCNLSCKNGNYSFTTRESSIRVDQSAAGGGGPGTVSVTTSDGAISLTGVTTPGYVFVKNLDSTNFVELGPDSGGAIIDFLKLGPGEYAVFRLASGVTLRGQANTATCKVLIQALEN